MKLKLFIVMALLIGFFLGYTFPRNHYEIRNGDHLCAVSWDGSAGCVEYEADWIPGYPY